MTIAKKGTLFLMVDEEIVVGVSLYLYDVSYEYDSNDWAEGIVVAKYCNQQPPVGGGCCIYGEEDLPITGPEEWV